MLAPEDRCSLTEIFHPPEGCVFDWALATTYSLDLDTLLSVPVYLALGPGAGGEQLAADPLALLEALRRVSARILVFCQEGQIHVPVSQRSLYAFLEQAIVQARALQGGAFHAKLWLVRYEPHPDLADHEDAPEVTLRLVVTSRNITADRSWDVALVMDGWPDGRVHAVNHPLADFIEALPKMTADELPPWAPRRIAHLAQEVRHTYWDLPEGFHDLRFHVFGVEKKTWHPSKCRRMAIISPFCSDRALERLARRAEQEAILVSRAETLEALSEETLDRFDRCLYLSDFAEIDDRDMTPEPAQDNGQQRPVDEPPLSGLHAKVYLMEKGSNLHVLLGSLNATDQALVAGLNVEILAELIGRKSRVGSIAHLIGPNGVLQPLLVDFLPTEAQERTDEDRAEAEAAVERAREAICRAGLRCRCTQRGEAWDMRILAAQPVALAGIRKAVLWPVTVSEERAVDCLKLAHGQAVTVPALAAESVTSLIAFRLTAETADVSAAFVLNLPTEGLPADREGRILTSLIRDREGFIRYLLLLLSDVDDAGLPTGGMLLSNREGAQWTAGDFETLPLLEEMVRVFSREPERLQHIEDLLSRLEKSPDGLQVLPEGFLEIWQAFRGALRGEASAC